jgi:hypothetical protein
MAVMLEGVAINLEENFMIIAGLVASICLGASCVAFFIWRDSKVE